MKVVLFLCAVLVVLTRGEIIDDIFDLPEHVLAAIPLTQDAASPIHCNDIAMNNCQYRFDAAIGIPTTYNWKSGGAFLEAVITKLDASSIPGFLKICRARREFYNCLGDQYSTCVNTYHLISEMTGTDNIKDAYRYVALYAELDFICNGGLDIAIAKWKGLSGLDRSPFSSECHDAFDASMATNPSNMCMYADQYAKCLQVIYNNHASLADGWWVCERTRSGFAKYCSSNTCQLTSQP
uniref:DUF725 domain-containing protein n=1 Tax=Rhabditophanes sp. KR3021 TaxID=114890 RepID=A0AC35TNM6_9BILA